ncbi:MAG: HD domain-containing protein [Spirochaetales bacterium]|nr:HD domain-containing protein [Spirochaetales bacterium]
MTRMEQQFNFLLEIDKLKKILRRNHISDGSKRENDAEHSWFFAVSALILSEYANWPVDISRVIKMALIHDIVEIDAGDTFVYDEKAKRDQQQRELNAADRIFGLLPDDQAGEFRALWNEFEENNTRESKYAKVIDRITPLILNFASNGKTWKEHGIRHDQVFEVNKKTAEGSVPLWEFIQKIIRESREKGFLA